MDEIEDEPDIREQMFHNNVREHIVSAFIILVASVSLINLP